jgi:hypothetical protein
MRVPTNHNCKNKTENSAFIGSAVTFKTQSTTHAQARRASKCRVIAFYYRLMP